MLAAMTKRGGWASHVTRSSRTWWRRAHSLVACSVIAAIPTHVSRSRAAQSVFIANVADASTNAPVRDAIVEMIDVGRTARTDWIGEAHFDNIPRGRHRVTVRHLGYAPAEVEIVFTRDTVGYVFVLSPSPPVLDTVRTTAKASAVPLKLQDFEMRRHMGIGRFLTDSVLQKERTQPIASIMARHFPGLFSSGFDQRIGRMHGGLPCWPEVYVDGFRYSGDALDLRFIDGMDAAGVEYYTETSAPVQYRHLGMACGVILIWLKYD